MSTMLKAFCLILMLAPALAAADTLVVTKVQADADSAAERPLRGMTTDAVLARFGEPSSLQAPVGTPPIARWNYEGYTVYFEGNHVLHTVVRR